MFRIIKIYLPCLLILAGMSALGQTNLPDFTNGLPALGQTNQAVSAAGHAEQIRADCVQGRRFICGKILKVLPDGLVIESGYTNLLRAPLDESWLVPGTVAASRAPNLVESREPGAMCVGLIFLTDIPKSRRAAPPKLYDYVIVQGYPAGYYTYNSLGTIQRTVRRFSIGLPTAVNLTLTAENQSAGPQANGK